MVVTALQKQEQDRDILVAQEIDAEITYGARQLIAYHRSGAPVDIKSWGTADIVYEDVTNQLMSYGMQQGMAQDMTHRLVQYAVAHADEFRAEHNAKIIAVRLTVNEMNPSAQFETGPVATFRLNGFSRLAEMASASGQNVRLTASGTATTSSDRSSVENVWQGVKEWSVWGKMEAPDKTELAGQTPALIAAALAQMADGALTPAEAATLQAQLEALAQEGLIAPELADIVRAVETMRAMMDGGMNIDASMAQPQILAEYISELIEQGLENGNLPPELARQVMESIAAFSEAYGLEQVFTGEMMQSLSATIEWTAITQTLSEIMPHLSAEGRAVIESMLDGGEVPSGDALAEQIVAINDIISQADLPDGVAEQIAGFERSLSILQETVQGQIDPVLIDASASATSEDLSSLSAADAQQIIVSMQEVGFPPEQIASIEVLQNAMEAADLANVTPEKISAVHEGIESFDSAVATQTISETLNLPMAAALSKSASEISSAMPVVSERDASLPDSALAPIKSIDAQATPPGILPDQKRADVINLDKGGDSLPVSEAQSPADLKANPQTRPDGLLVPQPSKTISDASKGEKSKSQDARSEPETNRDNPSSQKEPSAFEPEDNSQENISAPKGPCDRDCGCDFGNAAANGNGGSHTLTADEINKKVENKIKETARAVQSQVIGQAVQTGDLVVTRMEGNSVIVTDPTGKFIGHYESAQDYAKALVDDELKQNRFIAEAKNIKKETIKVSADDFSLLPLAPGENGLTPKFNEQDEGFRNDAKRAQASRWRVFGLG